MTEPRPSASPQEGDAPVEANAQRRGSASALAPDDKIPPPFRVAKPDEATLLSAICLSVAPHCRVATLSAERVIVKYDPARTYLTMTPGHWRALKFFREGRTVPQVIFEAIIDRACPPLREFYEIVLKAHASGILQADGQEPLPSRPPVDWRVQLPPQAVTIVSGVVIFVSLVAACIRPMAAPQSWVDLAIGLASASLALSLGNWLGAGVVRRANAAVYDARLHWRTLCPHFRVDLDDAIMAGPGAVRDAGVARLGPLFLALGLSTFLAPGTTVVLFGAVLAALSPFWWSPGLATIHALYGTRTLDAARDFRFSANREIWYAFTTRLKNTNARFVGVHSLYGTLWLGMVLLTSSLFLRANAEELWETYVAANGLHFTALALLSLLGLAVVSVLGIFAYIGFMQLLGWWRQRRPRKRLPRAAQITRESVNQSLADTILFQQLPIEDRALIAEAVEVFQYEIGSDVVTEGQEGDKLFIVYSGEVEVLRRLPNGGEDPVARLGPGDVFGEIALLERTPRTRTVRVVKPAVMLSLGSEAFEQLVLTKVSRQTICDTVQKIGFLQRVPLAAHWSTHAMAAFARRSVFRTFAEGSILIHEGEDNEYFYMLYEGELAVRRARKDIALLGIGEFFGEISLLQNSLAKATVVARRPTRCLALAKRDFLQFLANDFVLGLQFESISSKRLGQPIFPLKHGSFDVIRT